MKPRGHKRGCRCPVCSPATRKRGQKAAAKARQNPGRRPHTKRVAGGKATHFRSKSLPGGEKVVRASSGVPGSTTRRTNPETTTKWIDVAGQVFKVKSEGGHVFLEGVRGAVYVLVPFSDDPTRFHVVNRTGRAPRLFSREVFRIVDGHLEAESIANPRRFRESFPLSPVEKHDLARFRSKPEKVQGAWRIRRPDGQLVGAYATKKLAQLAILRSPETGPIENPLRQNPRQRSHCSDEYPPHDPGGCPDCAWRSGKPCPECGARATIRTPAIYPGQCRTCGTDRGSVRENPGDRTRRGNPDWVLEHVEPARSETEAEEMAAGMMRQQGAIGARVIGGSSRPWAAQGFFEDEPGATWLPEGTRRVMLTPGLRRLFGRGEGWGPRENPRPASGIDAMREMGARNYVRKLRNPAQKAYAQGWLEWRLYGDVNPDAPRGLSYMAAQAARTEIDSLLGVQENPRPLKSHERGREQPRYDITPRPGRVSPACVICGKPIDRKRRGSYKVTADWQLVHTKHRGR